ncbi:hypothetical protein [Myroides odoratimimus]|uniref:Uncharacterized protein n=1 Tax=Myroides odoratimimus CIP 101113 TaxID=883154 RepID=A0AAV3F5H6_9FLAO|nr:hypothetical protein [Myroides odoratimimus]EHO13811.1 hypothetical protein HMPREF9715_00885 [Myroides odoratimimus CIP 101113]
MLLISRLKEFVAECKSDIQAIKATDIVVSTDEVAKLMKEHNEENNILMIAIVPEHDIKGKEDSAMVDNGTIFYFLEKTDYSEVTQDGYLEVFERTQLVAKEFVEKILSDKEDNKFCGLFQHLADNVFQISPIKALSSCNGYFVNVSFKTVL